MTCGWVVCEPDMARSQFSVSWLKNIQPHTSITHLIFPKVLVSPRAEYVVRSHFEGTMMTAVILQTRRCNFHDFSTSTSEAHFLLQPELQLQLRNFQKIITSPIPARRVLQHGTFKVTPNDVFGAWRDCNFCHILGIS